MCPSIARPLSVWRRVRRRRYQRDTAVSAVELEGLVVKQRGRLRLGGGSPAGGIGVVTVRTVVPPGRRGGLSPEENEGSDVFEREQALLDPKRGAVHVVQVAGRPAAEKGD